MKGPDYMMYVSYNAIVLANSPQSKLPVCFITFAICTEKEGLSVFTSFARRECVLLLTEAYIESYMTYARTQTVNWGGSAQPEVELSTCIMVTL